MIGSDLVFQSDMPARVKGGIWRLQKELTTQLLWSTGNDNGQSSLLTWQAGDIVGLARSQSSLLNSFIGWAIEVGHSSDP